MAFVQANTILLLFFLIFFVLFLFRKTSRAMNGIFGFASIFTAIAMKWPPLVIGILVIFIIGVIFTYARQGGKT